jgi:hypothetical protein
MRADNSRHVIAAARRRAAATRKRAVAALRRMDKAGLPITFDSLSQQALLTEQSREFPQFSGWMTTESDMVCGHDRRW